MAEFNKHVGKFIDKEKAEKQIKNYKKLKLKTDSSFFGSDIIQDLINAPGAIGIRIHYAMDDEGYMQPVLTAEYNDSAPAKASTDQSTTYADASLGCPPYCPK